MTPEPTVQTRKVKRPYTARERELIRRDWRDRPVEEIAAELQRNPRDLYAAAVRFGVHTRSRRRKPLSPATEAKILALHARGLSNREIGRRLKHSHVSVQRVLARHGLKSNCRANNREPFPERWRRIIGDRYRNRIKRHGLFAAMACLRRILADRAAAVRTGWVEAGTFLEARILQFVADSGPSTVDEICAGVGRVSHYRRLVVRNLRNRGVLCNHGRRGRRVLYGLAAGVVPPPRRAAVEHEEGGDE